MIYWESNILIIQGGMLWLATAELAAAVSNAGALGTISPYAGMEKNGDPSENLRISDSEDKRFNKKTIRHQYPFRFATKWDLHRY